MGASLSTISILTATDTAYRPVNGIFKLSALANVHVAIKSKKSVALCRMFGNVPLDDDEIAASLIMVCTGVLSLQCFGAVI